MTYRSEMEATPEGQLAIIARAECYRKFDSIASRQSVRREYPPDFADFRAAFKTQVKIFILEAKLEEARLKPANGARVKELLEELGELKGKQNEHGHSKS
jgi:hypothetical protein